MFKHNNNNVFMLLFHYTKGTLIATKEEETSLHYIEEDRYERNEFDICFKTRIQFVLSSLL